MSKTQVIVRIDDPAVKDELIRKLALAHEHSKKALDLIFEVGTAIRGDDPKPEPAKPKPQPEQDDKAWFEPDHDSNETPCRSCGAPMLWRTTENGKKMPLDAQSEIVLGGKAVYRPHHMICPDAGKYRRKQ